MATNLTQNDFNEIRERNRHNGGDTEHSVASMLFERGRTPLNPPHPGQSDLDANPVIRELRDHFHKESK